MDRRAMKIFTAKKIAACIENSCDSFKGEIQNISIGNKVPADALKPTLYYY